MEIHVLPPFLKKLKIKCQESDIYFSPTTKEIIKTPKDDICKQEFLRVYQIGLLINKLSGIIPNFITTKKLHTQNSISYEYIKGNTLEKLLPTLTFPEFLNIYIQLLFALEIAGREYNFTHYDLHYANVILKPIKTPFVYTILLDNKKYKITCSKYIPIIIDYGLSCIKNGDKYIGNKYYKKYGIDVVPKSGIDMYKLLFYCYAKSNIEVQKNIKEIFNFYGTKDPYKIVLTPVQNLKYMTKEYLKKIYDSSVSDIIPLEMIQWLLSKYPNIIDIKVFDRDIYKNVKIEMKKDIQKIPSYIFCCFLTGKKCKLDVDKIKYDQAMLENYKSIEETNPNFYNLILPYLQYYYTIRELKLEDMFGKFIIEFPLSLQYNYYIKNIIKLETEKRKLKK
jgi:hypothetical protein